KPATLNGKEARILINLAKQKKLFFMEAVWTRFFPLAYRFQELLHEEKAIGHIHHVLVDYGLGIFYKVPESNRVFNPKLGGSVQLDGLLALQEHPENHGEPPSSIFGTSLPDPRTGVDLFTTIVLDYKKMNARADLCCNGIVSGSREASVRVLGTKGELCVAGAVPARPEALILRKYKDQETPTLPEADDYETTRMSFPIQGTGLHWEADAVARLVRDGKTTSDRCPPETTLLSMSIMDEWRRQDKHTHSLDGEKRMKKAGEGPHNWGGASSELDDEVAAQQDAQQDAAEAIAEGDLHPGVQSYTERATPASGGNADTGTLSEEFAEKEGSMLSRMTADPANLDLKEIAQGGFGGNLGTGAQEIVRDAGTSSIP
ncbi:MAG: hypothetical protein CYPHOPRED_000606, partial [Cyphobasidiales sp. Tagirdzhanova-0007]